MTTTERRVIRRAMGTFDGRTYTVQLGPGDVLVFRSIRSRESYALPLALAYLLAVKHKNGINEMNVHPPRARWIKRGQL